ncbi:MAG TPA: hypothetical protein VFE13_06090 [Caulobacteraceae bacterium]|jgi:hypothetical protein|nr:hypothetical protein [Caulobacteraceae bacterium]
MSDTISRVLITCPKLGIPVHTVHRMRAPAFEALRGEFRFRCDRCGEIHTWTREDAWLEDGARLRTDVPLAERQP